jgi:hypothetical protein
MRSRDTNVENIANIAMGLTQGIRSTLQCFAEDMPGLRNVSEDKLVVDVLSTIFEDAWTGLQDDIKQADPQEAIDVGLLCAACEAAIKEIEEENKAT